MSLITSKEETKHKATVGRCRGFNDPILFITGSSDKRKCYLCAPPLLSILLQSRRSVPFTYRLGV